MKYIKYIYIKIYFFICNPKEILPKKIKSGNDGIILDMTV